jgi:hypothetical protein
MESKRETRCLAGKNTQNRQWSKSEKNELENALSRQNKNFVVSESDISGDFEITNGKIAGKWSEKGSDNLARNVKASIYDPGRDRIYVIADGGLIVVGDGIFCSAS